MQSHPSRVRGLKSLDPVLFKNNVDVAPFTGAGIEIKIIGKYGQSGARVAPFTGAWIEIASFRALALSLISRTLHGCVD